MRFPMATPLAVSVLGPSRKKTPNGKFWIGKSAPGRLADSTQLNSAASCVLSEKENGSK
jgi:hypothetical protein